jgi:aryl-alcohol dehydrogenase-like predicted oxidoreductase
MEHRQLGKSPVKASAITFGAWAIGGWMWGGADRNDAIAAIRAAHDHGVTSFDTAPVYGQGLSEEILGEAIRGMSRPKIQILTKFGLRWDKKQGEYYFSSKDVNGRDIELYKLATKESIMEECENSLRRLNTDYIDLYQIHWPDATTPVAETMEALVRLKEQGKIRAAGVCNYPVALLDEALKVIDLASDQVPYSMLNREIEKDVVSYCVNENLAIIAYSPLQRGLLTGKIKPGHVFNAGDSREGNRWYTPENIVRVNNFLERLQPLAESKRATLAQLVLRWTIEQPGITIALAGARNPAQAIENAGAIKVKLTQEEMDFINGQIKQMEIVSVA